MSPGVFGLTEKGDSVIIVIMGCLADGRRDAKPRNAARG